MRNDGYIAHINNQDEYERALELMDELVDDYDTNKQLIELLATSIERWENGADEFADFNKALGKVRISHMAREHLLVTH